MKNTPANSNPLPPSSPTATPDRNVRRLLGIVGLVAAAGFAKGADQPQLKAGNTHTNIWAHENLVAWCAVPFDAQKRGPEERADMLARLGFKHFAYDWREEHVPTFDTEVEALTKRGIDLLAWWFPFSATDPKAKSTLEVFRRHGVHPQLWVMQSADSFSNRSITVSAEEQQKRVTQNAERIAALSALAAPYGCRIGLYNHNGWFGIMDNQLAVINRLGAMGISNVGIVYNFSHARDEQHDDSVDFPALWVKIKPHVIAVNVTGMRMDGQIIYPSQGDSELEMMRTIQDSGWTGPVGVIAEKGGDAEITLKNYLIGIDWLAAELRHPGSAGPRPFPSVP